MQSTLQHHGILGMKWGVRRYQNYDGSLTSAGKARKSSSSLAEVSSDHSKAHSSKSASSMSDKELRETINRLQMEQQYSKLTAKEKSAGAKFVQDVLTNVLTNPAKQTASNYVSKYMTKGVDAVIGKVIKK